MTTKVFLSHNHADKEFVRRLASDLNAHGIKYWLDEAEMKIGDSLIQKISEGLTSANYFIIVLSPNSVNTPWVKNELEIALTLEISRSRQISILPVLIKDCEIPIFLTPKLYADFRNENDYENSFEKLVRSMGFAFIKSAIANKPSSHNLGMATDKALAFNLRFRLHPFHRPFQYIGLTIEKAEREVNVSANQRGNISVEDEDSIMLLEAEGNYISYVDIELKETAPHFLNQEFDSEAILGSLSISNHELELIRKQTHFHTYYDHKRRLKVSVSCQYNGGPLSVGISSKYYNM